MERERRRLEEGKRKKKKMEGIWGVDIGQANVMKRNEEMCCDRECEGE